MFCWKCGTETADGTPVCTTCGAVQAEAQATFGAPTKPLEDDPVIRMILPVGRSGWAIAAGYMGLFAVLLVPAPLALILGIVALNDIKNNPKKLGKGRAIFGLVMGILGTVLLVWMIVASR